MLHGFGQAPVCIELDLDSYDGPWTHVERFRGRSGWLIVAEAHLSSDSAEWTTTVVAACDEYGEAVPGFMAPNLLACACSMPSLCDDFPPDELDGLLGEAADALKLQWLRDSNVALGRLAEAASERVAALEAQTTRQANELEHRIADLRRRLRMPGVPDAAREAFDEAIIGFELEREAAIDRLAERRAQMRRAIADEEHALIGRTHVQVEIEPLYRVSWWTATRPSEDRDFARDHQQWFSPSRDEGLRAFERAGDAADLRAAIRRAQNCPLPPAAPRAVPPNKPAIVFIVDEPVMPAPIVIVDPPPSLVAVASSPPTPPTPAMMAGKLEREHIALKRELAVLEAIGRKFHPGSKKFKHNLEQREAVAQRIASLKFRIGNTRPPTATLAATTVVLASPPATLDRCVIGQQREQLAAQLRAHEQRGVLPEHGRNRFIRFAERRKALIAEIEKLDRRVVAVDHIVKAGS